MADKEVKSNFKKLRNNRIVYKSNYKGTETMYYLTINDSDYLNRCSCDCKYFVKHAVCMHLVAYGNLFDYDLFEGRYSKKLKKVNFVKKNKKGAKKGGREKYGKALDKDL